MALKLGVRRAVKQFVPMLAASSAAIISFQFFEDMYAALGGVESTYSAHKFEDPVVEAEAILHSSSPGWGTKLIRVPADTVSLAHDAQDEEFDDMRLVTLRANSYGHFTVTAFIDGSEVELMTDTGATYVALSYETALGLGYRPEDLPFTSESETANGVARVAPIMLREVRVGDIVVRDVQAVVAEPGKMSQNLLGMSFINRLSRFEVSGRKLTLTQ